MYIASRRLLDYRANCDSSDLGACVYGYIALTIIVTKAQVVPTITRVVLNNVHSFSRVVAGSIKFERCLLLPVLSARAVFDHRSPLWPT